MLCGVVLCGVVLCGVVLCGVVLCGVVLCGVVLCVSYHARVRECTAHALCVGSGVAVWCSGLCSRFPIETLRVRSPPSTVSHVFLLLFYLWVVTNSQNMDV